MEGIRYGNKVLAREGSPRTRRTPGIRHETIMPDGPKRQRKEIPTGAVAEIREALRLNPEKQAYRTRLNALLKSQRTSTMPSP